MQYNMNKYKLFHTAIYIRLSREDGDKMESDSIVNQRKLIEDYLKDSDDLVVFDTYIDEGFTGTNYNRPAFRKMIADVDAGNVNCVIVKDLSRFGRDYIDTGKYLERYFPKRNVRFIAITDNIDSMKQAYDMLLPIKNIFNEQYARDISRKVHASITTKQKAGEFIGAFASYGYKKSPSDKNKLIIDEYAAEVVRKIFRLYIEGYGKLRIAGMLNEQNIFCPSEYKKLNGENYRNSNRQGTTCYWTYSTINHILQNEMYIGNMVQGKTHQHMHTRARLQDKADWYIIQGTHEPVIDHDTWKKAQALLHKRTRAFEPESGTNIFAGFLKCGECGRALCKKGTDGNIRYYCGTYIRLGRNYCTPHATPHSVLENIILQDFKALLQSVGNLSDSITSKLLPPDTLQNQTGGRCILLQNELQKIRKLKKEVYEDYKENLISKNEYINYHQEYMKKEELLSKQLEQSEAAFTRSASNMSGFFWTECLARLKKSESLTRGILVEMIHEIKVYENHKIIITYNFSKEADSLFAKHYNISDLNR